MSCDVAAAAFLFLASASPSGPQPMLHLVVAAAPSSVAHEPLFADIVGRAAKLKAEIDAYRGSDLVYSFVTRGELAAMVSEEFDNPRFVSSGAYSRSDHYPLLVAERRPA